VAAIVKINCELFSSKSLPRANAQTHHHQTRIKEFLAKEAKRRNMRIYLKEVFMGKEVERKFLVKNLTWKKNIEGILYQQGYLSSVKERTVRVRIAGEKAFLTIKGVTVGVSRSEFEYEVPLEDAAHMLNELCEHPIIEKRRYKLLHAGLTWEIDEFLGENNGLIVAEIELSDEEQTFELPAWVGEEVSHDIRYFNSNLLKNPYSKWNHE
jgi:adenylate cyclase